MTGTAMTEDAEFREIYKLPVVAIPPNRPVARKDEDDLVYRTVEAKFNAVADDVTERHESGPAAAWSAPCPSRAPRSCPRLLDKRGIEHDVLEREEPRARGTHRRAGGPLWRRDHRHEHGRPRHRHPAGRQPRRAGRRRAARARARSRTPNLRPRTASRTRALPTDEQLRGRAGRGRSACDAEERDQRASRPAACTVIGTERHESRRIDNQLRGRAGRQGDPGVTAVLPVARRTTSCACSAATAWTASPSMMETTDMPRGHAHPGRHGVEGHREAPSARWRACNFAARKNVLEYDDVMNVQRVGHLR